jgi:putative transposase
LWSAGYFCRTTGAVTDEMIKEYIERQQDDGNETFKITDTE